MADFIIVAAAIVLVAVIAVSYVRRVGSGGCACGCSNSERAPKPKRVEVADTDEAHYPYAAELIIGGHELRGVRAQRRERAQRARGHLGARRSWPQYSAHSVEDAPLTAKPAHEAVRDAGYSVRDPVGQENHATRPHIHCPRPSRIAAHVRRRHAALLHAWCLRHGRYAQAVPATSCAIFPLRACAWEGRWGPSQPSSTCSVFWRFPLMARGDLAWLVWLAAALLAFALICGGAYHAQYAYLSIIAKAGHEDLYEEVSANIMLLMRLATTPMYAGFILFAIAIVLGQTVFPVWFCRLHAHRDELFRSRVDAHAAASAVHSLRRVEQPRVHDHVHCYAHLPARLITTGTYTICRPSRSSVDRLSGMDATSRRILSNSWRQVLPNSQITPLLSLKVSYSQLIIVYQGVLLCAERSFA